MPKKSPLHFPDVPMNGKTVVITGSNTGIGKETAKQLARLGARIILACRSRERGEAAVGDIIEETGNNNVVFKALDLSSLQSVKNFADDFNESEQRLDVLINNAGLVTKERTENAEGVEMTFAVNHLGHFYLTNLLLEKLKASAPSRIVILTSMTHKFAQWDIKDPEYKRKFKGINAYARTKTANILHATHLAKLLKGTGVSTYAVHPGAILETDITRSYGRSSMTVKALWAFVRVLGDKNISIEDGAKTTLYCTLEPSIASHSGRYYAKCKAGTAKGFATKAETAQKLWEYSMELCKPK